MTPAKRQGRPAVSDPAAVRAAWGETVSRALDRRRLTPNAAAHELGVTRNTLVSWLQGRTDADPQSFGRIADLTGLSHVLLLELAGLLPPEMGPVAYQLQATRELKELLETARTWVDQSVELVDLRPAAQVAGTLLARSADWHIELRPALRGRRYRIVQHTYVGLRSLHDPHRSVPEQRQELSELLGDLYARFGLTWREQQPHDYPGCPALVLQVPDQERPRVARTPLVGPRSILVVGLPYGHAEFLASVLAEAYGYAYADLRYGPEGPGLVVTEPARRTEIMVRQARRLLAGGHEHLVWSVGNHQVLEVIREELLRTAAPPVVVVVEPGDRLQRRGCEIWGLSPAEMGTAHGHLRALLQEPAWPCIGVNIDDERVCEDGRVHRDLLVDETARLAMEVLRELHLKHSGPAPRLWRGLAANRGPTATPSGS